MIDLRKRIKYSILLRIYAPVRKMMLEVAMGVPEVSDNLRKELEMWDVNWFQPSDIDPTE